MAQVLNAAGVSQALSTIDGWAGDQTGISKTVELPSFPAAINVVVRVAEVAEAMDHHPDIDIRWRTLSFRCATHSAGGVTRRDIDLAGRIDDILGTVRP
ncbi:MAG TPA: 4a-hydroxytetrahydrobiopterin dehydratase [Mycobacteriales bacterium]|nr:4a-hydroxytetrahydrobiopterin dehydratase [Mycobacteriales bacterium]